MLSKFKEIIKQPQTIISGFCIFVLMFMYWQLLETIVVINIDDVMYSDWTQHGISYFIEKNVWHYTNFNGRAFVHLILQIVLIFDEHLYAILIPIFIFISSYLFIDVIKKEWHIATKMFASSLTILFVIGLSYRFQDHILWMSGGFNYIFPLFIISIFYWLFINKKEKNKSLLYLIPLSFLCGATTEQYGMFTIGLIICTSFFQYIKTKKINKKDIICIFCSVCGLTTIIFSPSTMTRLLESNKSASIASFSLYDGYLRIFSFIGGNQSAMLLPIALMLLLGCCAILKNKNIIQNKITKIISLLGFPLAIILYVSRLYSIETLNMIITTLYVIALIILFLLNENTRKYGKLLLCGFGTLFMMSITMQSGNRTCIPCILSFFIVMSIILIDTFVGNNKKVLNIILIALLILTNLNTYWTILDNYTAKEVYCKQIYSEFINAKNSGVINIDFDESIATPTPKFRYMSLQDNARYEQVVRFREKFEIPKDTKVYFKSEMYETHSVLINEEYLFVPAIKLNNKIYVPMTTATRLFEKISTKQNDDNIEIYIDNKIFNCNTMNSLEIKLYGARITYVEIDTFCNMFDLKYINRENKTIEFTNSSQTKS